MTESRTPAAAPDVPVGVLEAGAVLCAGAGTLATSAVMHQDAAAVIVLSAFPLFAAAGGIVLDRWPSRPVGRAAMWLGVLPVVVFAWTFVRFGRWPQGDDLARGLGDLAAVPTAYLGVVLPLAFRPAHGSPKASVPAGLAALGAGLVLATGVLGGPGWLRWTGWSLVWLGILAVWALVGRAAAQAVRTERRRTTWVLAALAVTAAGTAVSWAVLPRVEAAYCTGGLLALLAIALVRLVFVTDFRPLDEPALDLAVALAAVGVAALMAGLARLGSEWTRLPSPNTSAAFTALTTFAMAVPAALWARRAWLSRRYGSGIIAPSDVAQITADLHSEADPRELLDKAATMVAAASGSREARIVLGDAPVAPQSWAVYPLVVAGDQVGALLVDPRHREGPELRQQQVVRQLLPTVALVARAVGLAVEAEHARRDVTRERDAERARILGDLHDGLGPVLAGMSMRVRAALRTAPASGFEALLGELAADLSMSRADLRRLVAGLTPSVLRDGDLDSALGHLVDSFRSVDGGPELTLSLGPQAPLPAEIEVAVYRSIAEGLTNALRHARATAIEVRVRCDDGRVCLDVVDDGTGGPVVPGVGLSSIGRRAASLGGHLEVGPARPHGTCLHVELPVRAEVGA